MKNLLLIIFFFSINQLFAQEIVGMKDLYTANDLTYKMSDDQLFTGQAQHVRKNGHLVYEEYFVDGKLTKSMTYYNSTEEPIPASVTEYYDGTKNIQKVTNYGLSKPTTEFKYYDKNGEKKLIEHYENDKLIYRCQYLDNKKHGTEFCLNDDGTEQLIEYRRGKKIKQK